MKATKNPSELAVLAVDWGSQSVRCAIFARDGERLSYHRQALPGVGSYSSASSVASAHNAGDYQNLLWQTIAATHAACAHAVKLEAIAICAQRSGLVGIDTHGNVQPPALFWHDVQWATQPPQPPWWIKLGCQLVGQGARLQHLLRQGPANRMREFHHDSWAQARYLLPWSAFLNWCLSGRAVDGISGATGIYPFHFRRRQWRQPHHWAWHALSMAPQQVPHLHPAGRIIASVSAAAAHRTGLPTGTPIAACGADKAAEALGAGATAAGALHLSLGSAATINYLSTRRRNLGILHPTFPSLQAGINLREWQLDQGMRVVSTLTRLNPAYGHTHTTEAELDQLLALPGPAGTNLLCYPEHYPNTVEQWLPEVLQQRPLTHLYPAMMEGMAYTLVQALQRVTGTAIQPDQPVIVSGGGSRSAPLTEMLAQVMQRPLIVAEDSDCGLRGAAMCAASAAGWYPQPGDAHRLSSPHRRLIPDLTIGRRYRQHYRQHWQPNAKQQQPLVYIPALATP